MHQTPTDHRREHHDLPSKPGQCFILDAYSHTSYSTRGYKYCDIYTYMATRRGYPVITKDRSAHELCEQSNERFCQHDNCNMSMTPTLVGSSE